MALSSLTERLFSCILNLLGKNHSLEGGKMKTFCFHIRLIEVELLSLLKNPCVNAGLRDPQSPLFFQEQNPCSDKFVPLWQ